MRLTSNVDLEINKTEYIFSELVVVYIVKLVGDPELENCFNQNVHFFVH